MEILLGITWPGGETFEVLNVDGNNVGALFAWLDEEPPSYIEEEGRKYFYDDDERIYFNSGDDENSTGLE